MADISTRGVYDAAGRVVVASVSGISWGAVLAGAFVAGAVTLILASLGAGLGLSSASFWTGGPSATTFAIGTAVWLIVTQWLSAGLGGYVAGRLRTRWIGTHEHEVYFRDTAHGFVTWAVATVILAILIASAAGFVARTGTQAASQVASGASQGAAQALSPVQLRAYGADVLFRSNPGDISSSGASASGRGDGQENARYEAMRILANGTANGDVPDADKAYLANLISARTGVSQDEAKKRVDEVIAQEQAAAAKAKDAADKARKATANLAIFTALSMVVGAFIAAIAAALGGHERELHP